MDVVGVTATLTGAVERAATLPGVFTALFDQLGAVVEAMESRLRDADHARLRAELGGHGFDEAYRRGMRLPFEDLLVLASLHGHPGRG